MTTVTDADLKEIKEAIADLKQQINDLDKNLTGKIIELSGKIDTNNAKIEALDKRVSDGLNSLDKRITTQEFIYRAVFISIIGLLTTSAATSAIRYFWDNPLFPLR